ncbi:hypothetical protein [Streptomyces sp. SID12488]|uniref:hypothetical protein n=1 Tax=Streptomyces sp. SID12488 TaxID=2706040 RepID=UPI0013DB2719|nr:hypothetical protein [Streptomyces sp. SID12488]NEA62971.1 hypothetical protein [Streptomyces sp. SID12488]
MYLQAGASGSGAASAASRLAGGDAGFITVGGALKGSLFVGAVTLSAYDVAEAPPAQKLHTASRDAAGLAGGLSGAAYGAEVGASIGSVFPGAGTVVGGVVGGIIASGVASEVADKVMNWF